MSAAALISTPFRINSPSESIQGDVCCLLYRLVHLINTTGLKAGSARPASLARVPMWNRKDSRKISGRAAPLEANVTVSSSVVLQPLAGRF